VYLSFSKEKVIIDEIRTSPNKKLEAYLQESNNNLPPAYLYDLDDELFIEDFTVGYHVIGEKK